MTSWDVIFLWRLYVYIILGFCSFPQSLLSPRSKLFNKEGKEYDGDTATTKMVPMILFVRTSYRNCKTVLLESLMIFCSITPVMTNCSITPALIRMNIYGVELKNDSATTICRRILSEPQYYDMMLTSDHSKWRSFAQSPVLLRTIRIDWVMLVKNPMVAQQQPKSLQCHYSLKHASQPQTVTAAYCSVM